VVVDCAHNLEGAAALATHLGGLEHRFHLLFSCLDDKPVTAMAAVLRPVVGEVAVCELADERAMPLARLLAAFPGARAASGPAAALAALPDPVLAAGSVRLVGSLLTGSNGGQAW
jgi:folylpolyglutamate synthase/dihydropteroate synthase